MRGTQTSIKDPYYVGGITKEQAAVIVKSGISLGYNAKTGVIAINKQDKEKVMTVLGNGLKR